MSAGSAHTSRVPCLLLEPPRCSAPRARAPRFSTTPTAHPMLTRAARPSRGRQTRRRITEVDEPARAAAGKRCAQWRLQLGRAASLVESFGLVPLAPRLRATLPGNPLTLCAARAGRLRSVEWTVDEEKQVDRARSLARAERASLARAERAVGARAHARHRLAPVQCAQLEIRRLCALPTCANGGGQHLPSRCVDPHCPEFSRMGGEHSALLDGCFGVAARQKQCKLWRSGGSANNPAYACMLRPLRCGGRARMSRHARIRLARGRCDVCCRYTILVYSHIAYLYYRIYRRPHRVHVRASASWYIFAVK